MTIPKLLPADVAASVEMLVDEAARRHHRNRLGDDLVIVVGDVWTEGQPAGDYEVIVRPKKSALGRRLSELNNPWMRVFERSS